MSFVVNLNRNEYFFPHAPKVQEALLRFGAAENFCIYASPARVNQLKNELSGLLQVSEEFITLGHGGEDLLIKLLTWLRGMASNVVRIDFSWQTYVDMALGLGFNINTLPCFQSKTEFYTDLQVVDAFLELQPQMQVVIITSPNNPTGHALSTENVANLIAKNPRHIFIFDGVYDIPNSDKITLVQQFSNLFFIGSFSKFFGLPGLRMGYAIGQKIPKAFNLPLGLSPLAIEVALMACQEYKYYFNNLSIMLSDAANLQLLSNDKVTVFVTKAQFVLMELFLPLSINSELFLQASTFALVKPKVFAFNDRLFLRWGLGPTHINQRINTYLDFLLMQ